MHPGYTAPDGQHHSYAMEREFPPNEIRDIFEKNGMRMVHHELFWGGLGRLPEPLYQVVMVPLQNQWWLGHNVALRQLVVATPK